MGRFSVPPQTEVHVYRAKILLITRILIRPEPRSGAGAGGTRAARGVPVDRGSATDPPAVGGGVQPGRRRTGGPAGGRCCPAGAGTGSVAGSRAGGARGGVRGAAIGRRRGAGAAAPAARPSGENPRGRAARRRYQGRGASGHQGPVAAGRRLSPPATRTAARRFGATMPERFGPGTGDPPFPPPTTGRERPGGSRRPVPAFGPPASPSSGNRT